jgi:hypothetical protein
MVLSLLPGTKTPAQSLKPGLIIPLQVIVITVPSKRKGYEVGETDAEAAKTSDGLIK